MWDFNDGFIPSTPNTAQKTVQGKCSVLKKAVQAPVLSWTEYLLKDVEVAYFFTKLRWKVFGVLEDYLLKRLHVKMYTLAEFDPRDCAACQVVKEA